MEELISIIVPVYNVEKYLRKCIESIINQTYKNLEIILIDDGSTDNSGSICDNYAEKDRRIKTIHKKNGGLSDARNTGLNLAEGEYIVFIDSDDYIKSEMVEKLYLKIKQTDADMIICNLENVDENGNILLQYISPIKNEVADKCEALKKLVPVPHYWYYVTAVNRLYKKKIFNKLRFPVGKIHEDEFAAHYIFDECKKIAFTDEKMYNYLRRSGSITGTPSNKIKTDDIEAFLDRTEFFIGKKMYAEAVKVMFCIIEKCKEKKLKNVDLKRRLKRVCIRLSGTDAALKDKIKLLVFAAGETVCKLLNRILAVRLRLRKKHIEKNFSELVATVREKKDVCVFIMATPCHGNLGDHAIVKAEYRMLEKLGLGECIIEIPNTFYNENKDIIKKYVSEEDIVVIDGGGNLGSLWPHEDDKISEIIESYHENKIIVFPQTCYYENNDTARILRNREIYKKAKYLTITLRDRKSYDFCKENFPETHCEFTPDVVLSLSYKANNSARKGILFCFREDREKNISDNEIEKLIELLGEDKIEKISTVLSCNVSQNEREERLSLMLDKISKSTLLITDRLHAMIFAVITGTPCLALDNKSKKVSGVFEWIAGLDYIKICNNMSELSESVPEMIERDIRYYDNGIFANDFEKIEKLIMQQKGKKNE